MKKLLLYSLFLLFTVGAIGQKVKFEASVSKTSCEVGEKIQLTFSSNTQGDLELPELKNCKIVAGPMSESSTRIVSINGRTTMETTHSQIYLISFTKKGDQVIPPAKFVSGGKTYHTQAIHVTVGASTSGNDDASNRDEKLFITVSLSKSKVYKGEHLIATYRLYTLYRNVNHNLVDYTFPSQKGFWTQELETPSTLQFEDETVNGKRYAMIVFKKQLLIPQTDGKIKLEPFKVTWRLSNIFDSQDFQLSSNTPTIDVLPLPEGAPESFNGAVGDFSFQVNYSKPEMKVNDGLDITIKIKGKGNLKFINNFELEVPNEIDKNFDPEVVDTINVNSSGMYGSRTFKYLVIPMASGKYKLQPIEFTYFDPEARKYKTLSSGEFELNVLKSDGTTDNTVIKQQGRVKVLDKEIRHLREYTDDIREKGNYFFGSPLFFVAFFAGPLSFFLFLFIRKKIRKSDSQIEQQKVKKATRVALRHMQHAKTLLDEKNIAGFYDEAMKTLYEYTTLKLGLPNSEFSKENIIKKLTEKKIEEATITQFVKTIENCEMARFGGHNSGFENQIYSDSVRLIETLEDKL